MRNEDLFSAVRFSIVIENKQNTDRRQLLSFLMRVYLPFLPVIHIMSHMNKKFRQELQNVKLPGIFRGKKTGEKDMDVEDP